MENAADARALPPAIAADALLSIPYRSCERLKGGLGLLEPRTGVTVSARVRARVRVESATAVEAMWKPELKSVLSCTLNMLDMFIVVL